jgi:hypothetical protein
MKPVLAASAVPAPPLSVVVPVDPPAPPLSAVPVDPPPAPLQPHMRKTDIINNTKPVRIAVPS